MTTPEERRLAALLQDEAELLGPNGDALARIRGGVARRRTHRRAVLTATAVTASAALVGVLALAGGPGPSSLQPAPPATQPAPSPGATSSPTPSPSPSATPTAVRRDPAPVRDVPGPEEAFVAVQDGVVGLYSPKDGRRLKQVSFPPPGYADTTPRRSGTRVLWLRLGRSCDDRRLIQRDLATDLTSTLVKDQPLVPGALATSPDGRWTGWAVRPGCGDDADATTVLHVRGPQGAQELNQDAEGEVGDLALRDDGLLLLATRGEDGGYLTVVSPDGSGGGGSLDAEMDCLLFDGDFLGDRVVAMEQCDPFSASPPPLRRVELSLTGRRLSTVQTQLPSVDRLTAAGDQVLVQRFEPSGAIGRLVGKSFEVVLEQPACRETLEARGCITEIDW